MVQKKLKKNDKPKEKPKEKIVRPKRKPRPKDKPNYVDRKEFQDEMILYYNEGDCPIPEKLGIFIKKIANGLSFAPNFINYSYKEEMIGDALVKMVAALEHKKFKIDSGHNPFSYFTTIAFHAFINRIKKEKKHRQTITDFQDQVYDDMMSAMGVDGTATDQTTNDDD